MMSLKELNDAKRFIMKLEVDSEKELEVLGTLHKTLKTMQDLTNNDKIVIDSKEVSNVLIEYEDGSEQYVEVRRKLPC